MADFLLKVSRPRFWIYVFGPYIVGLACGIVTQTDFLNWKVALFALYFLFPANLLIYGVNDIFDYETDRLNAKKTEYETLVAPDRRKELWIAILITNLPFIAVSAFLGVKTFLAMLGFLFFSCFYSAPPIRAKTKPLIDSIFNILYVFPAIFAYAILTNSFPPFLTILAGGLWTMAMHAYSAVPDIEADKQAGFSTIATWLGSLPTLLFCLALYLASAAISFQYLCFLSVILAIVYAIMIFVSIKFNQTNQVFKVYKYFPIINSIAGFLLFWAIAFDKFKSAFQ